MIELKPTAVSFPTGCVLTIGNFDGVHLGHRALIHEAVNAARAMSLPSVVWTFADHPQSTLGNIDIKYCIDEADKQSLMEKLGVDCYYAADFASYKDVSAEDFIKSELVGRFNVKCVICGYDFRFGKGGCGDSTLLRQTLSEHGSDCKILPAVTVDGSPVSSTRLRTVIAGGDMKTARALLGSPYGFTLPVEHGRQLGRRLGHPTINQLLPPDRVVPAYGVYAVLVTVDGVTYKGVTNIGVKPTVTDDAVPMCETHIFRFDGNLYGKPVRVCLYEKLRDERRFPSLDALRAQIAADAAEAERVLAAI